MADTTQFELSRNLAEEFLRVSRHELDTAVERIEHCFGMLTREQIWSREHETENSIGNLVLHLCGNVRQWIISGVGGAPDHRNRDAEFAQREPLDSADLLRRLKETVGEAHAVLAKLRADDLLARRKIQAYEVSVLHAVYHVVEHFGGHTGQILWATKRLTGKDLGFYAYLNQKDADSSGRAP